jgi:DNA-binding transcriptional LysR family regulator
VRRRQRRLDEQRLAGEGPAGGGYQTRPLGEIDWVFAMAPVHPLATAPEPLTRTDILAHRAIVVADSSRNLPPRTTGLLSGQDTLTIADAAAKLEAQVMGLGVGYLPQCLATAAAARGALVIKQTEEPKVSQMLFLAWRTAHRGKALKWFVDQVLVPGWLDRALGPA